MKANTEPANRINHFVMVLDESWSMNRHADALVRVFDGFVADMAARSTEMNQETRVTVYTFNSATGVKCLIYDMDVLRRPSIAGRFHPNGRTPMIDATLQSIDELAETPERYGEHSFVVFILTDGQENASRKAPSELSWRIQGLPAHWTVASFVPDSMAVAYAKRCGFPAGNIDKWDTTSARGVVEFGGKIRDVSASFMEARTQGVRGSRSIFTIGQVSPQEAAANLDALSPRTYTWVDVPIDCQIRDLIERATARPYIKGQAFYQLTKPETIQSYKQIAILTPDGKVYSGPAARRLLGLPSYEIKVEPAFQPGTTIFVQSTSVNRRLKAGTRVLLMDEVPAVLVG